MASGAKLLALSQRESEVLELLAMGRTNQQIADALVISPFTVARHVSSILAKTGAANRTEAARFASQGAKQRAHHTGLRRVDVFVGRERELLRLREALEAAVQGRGGLVMVAGEPGIGKTRLVEELELHARIAGARVLWGRNHENSGAPPFWPWVEAGREWAAATAREEAVAAMLAGGPDLARLFPELRRVPGLDNPQDASDLQTGPFRLFTGYTAFMAAASAGAPVVICLDDLQWTDKPSLLLLQHFAREVATMRVLLVGTYRDTDVNRKHPLSEALANLARYPGFDRIVLRRLSESDTRTYLGARPSPAPHARVVDRIVEQTEGNPFFLVQVVNLMEEAGGLSWEGETIAIPDGVREALGRRLDRLSDAANEFLRDAAVVGREWTYETMQILRPGLAQDLLDLIDESLAGHVIEEMEQPGDYRFVHALIQETLLSELGTTRRVRLHGEVGEALERRWGDHADEHASLLATHFGESATLSPAHEARAKRYALSAAAQAGSQYAWAEAARWYEAAVAGDPDPEPDLLVRYAGALKFAEQFSAAKEKVLERAYQGYRARGDLHGLAAAAATAQWWHDPPAQVPLLRECLAVPGLDVRVELEVRRSLLLILMLFFSSRIDEIRELARSISRLADGPEVVDGHAIRTMMEGYLASGAGDSAHAADLHRTAGREFLSLGEIEKAVWAFGHATTASFGANVTGTMEDAREMWQAARKGGGATGQANGTVYLAAASLLRWLPEEILLIEEQRRADRSGAFEADGEYDATHALATYRELLGDRANGYEEWSHRHRGTSWEAPVWRVQYLARVIVGKHPWVRASDARAEFERWQVAWQQTDSHYQRVEAFSLAALFLLHLGDNDFWTDVWTDVQSWKNLCATMTGLSTDPARGLLALRLGLVDEAEQAFRDGLEWAEREDCPVELGRNLQGLAAVAERRGDIPGALEYLDLAAAQYEPRGVKLFLDEVLAARARLTDGSEPQAS